MNLTDHFTQHLSSDLAESRRLITCSVLSDPGALVEIEERAELWLELPIATICRGLEKIDRLRQGDTAAHLVGIQQAQVEIGRVVETLFMSAIDKWINEEFDSVDLPALLAAENIQEPKRGETA